MKTLSFAWAATTMTLVASEAMAQVAPCASDEAWAARYSDQSLSALGSINIGSGIVLGRDSQSTSIGLGGELRWIRSGWALSPRLTGWLGVANAGAAGSISNTVVGSVAPALFAGVVRPVAERINLGAMVGYEFSYQGALTSGPTFPQLSHSATVEGLLTVHLGRSAFLEPRLRASYVHTELVGVSASAAGGGSASASTIDRVVVGLSVQGGYVF